jgi:hypothetical protein
MGRALIWAGILLIFLGILFSLGGNLWNKIPGNIQLRGKNWTLYFPLGICLVISLLGTLLLWLFGRR